jgi:hypothetical protein
VGDFTLNDRYRAHVLNIARPSKNSNKNVRGVQGVACMLHFRVQLVVNMRMSGAGHLVHKTNNRATQAWFLSRVCK